MIVVAHVGHWAVSLIYAAPALLLAGALAVSTLRQRRRDAARRAAGGERPAA
jgi:hypothetical protein